MTRLTFTLALDNDANLTITDTTGFYHVTTNPYGFNSIGVVDLDRMALEDGYFLNAITFNAYNKSPVLLNTTETLYTPETLSTTYANNFEAMSYKLSQDGVFSVKRYFIISEAYYTANISLYEDFDIVYYTDGTYIYKVEGATTTTIAFADFAIEANVMLAGCVTIVKFVSTYYMSQCYNILLDQLIDEEIAPLKCAYTSPERTNKDLIYMALEVIKYHKKVGNTVRIQKIIESLNTCSGICRDVLPTDCGCNG